MGRDGTRMELDGQEAGTKEKAGVQFRTRQKDRRYSYHIEKQGIGWD